jgi:tetratricopeptide (TPR) repeat protein
MPTMKRQTLVSRGSLSRLFQEAAESWRKQDYEQTIALLKRASELDPANSTVLFDLGRAYGLRYQYDSAENYFEKAIRIAPRKVEALIEAGRRSQAFGHYEMAARYFDRATRERGAPAEAFLTLAELYERGPRAKEATALVERALTLDPNHWLSLLARARWKRLGGALEEAEKFTRELLQKTSCDPQTRIRAWYELGTILDRQGRFDEAMKAFLEAKALQRPIATRATAILQGIQARVNEQQQTITAATLERWATPQAELGTSRRLAILCGHPRSGTTLLEQMLDGHPQIVSAEETHILHDEAYLPLSRGFNESNSLLEVLEAAAPSQLRQSRENYFRFTESFVQKSIGNKLLIDKNPALNVLIPAVIRIFPEAKFLVALRDPRDVCLSCFMQHLSLNPVSSAYLTLEGTATQYASVMGFWRAMLPRMRNPSLEVRYEDLVEDLPATARRATDFLAVEWDPRVLKFHEHARTKPVRSPSYADVGKPLFKRAVGRWRNYEKYVEPLRDKLAPFVTAYGYA